VRGAADAPRGAGESALAPRLAVWGLVAASSVFNWTHAPDHPGARAAFALMPVITIRCLSCRGRAAARSWHGDLPFRVSDS
jgi:hypothetical protein